MRETHSSCVDVENTKSRTVFCRMESVGVYKFCGCTSKNKMKCDSRWEVTAAERGSHHTSSIGSSEDDGGPGRSPLCARDWEEGRAQLLGGRATA
uniref:Heat shock protein family A (Hsp70) member 12A n=1 Tax=Pipistrellus kuhlii TaxID=59472 RepID=A0A7J7VAY0_PIPKU|nr:heat shock protein family A (Hsp70) member 12A [Pipistrellus kuhlii]